MDDRLATIDMGRKEGDVPLSEGELGPIKHNVAWAEVCLHTKWHLDCNVAFHHVL